MLTATLHEPSAEVSPEVRCPDPNYAYALSMDAVILGPAVITKPADMIEALRAAERFREARTALRKAVLPISLPSAIYALTGQMPLVSPAAVSIEGGL